MSETTADAPILYPYLRYDDAPRAIRWLVEAFGFREQLVVEGPQGTIAHAQLAFGDGGLLLLGSVAGDEVSPAALASVPGGTYAFVEDPDVHCERARKAGATITREPNDTEYGSREYSAVDCEGHHWSFGTYRPAAE